MGQTLQDGDDEPDDLKTPPVEEQLPRGGREESLRRGLIQLLSSKRILLQRSKQHAASGDPVGFSSRPIKATEVKGCEGNHQD